MASLLLLALLGGCCASGAGLPGNAPAPAGAYAPWAVGRLRLRGGAAAGAAAEGGAGAGARGEQKAAAGVQAVQYCVACGVPPEYCAFVGCPAVASAGRGGDRDAQGAGRPPPPHGEPLADSVADALSGLSLQGAKESAGAPDAAAPRNTDASGEADTAADPAPAATELRKDKKKAADSGKVSIYRSPAPPPRARPLPPPTLSPARRRALEHARLPGASRR